MQSSQYPCVAIGAEIGASRVPSGPFGSAVRTGGGSKLNLQAPKQSLFQREGNSLTGKVIAFSGGSTRSFASQATIADFPFGKSLYGRGSTLITSPEHHMRASPKTPSGRV